MANADQRLVTTLQQIRNGKFIYGYEHVGRTSPLESYCEDLDLPKEWGNPAKTVPIPCEACFPPPSPVQPLLTANISQVVHGGSTKICEVYALKRAWTAIWSTALPIYLGLNAVKFLRPQVPQPKALLKALLGAFRSSAFLGSFVGLFWYAICLTRTRLGPKFTSLDPLALENLGIKVGCAMCGWSILVENPKRRTEIAFFVVPRALACLVPRKYGRKVVTHSL